MDEMTPEERRFSKQLQGLVFLIADPTASRKSFRALLSYYGVKPNQIQVVENAPDAKSVLEATKPNVVFADYELGGENCYGLVHAQHEHLDASDIRVFFLVSSRNSNSLLSSAADESVDAVLVKPFTFADLKKHFRDILEQKVNPTPYVLQLQAGKDKMKQGLHEEAITHFVRARTLDPAPALACAYEGMAYQQMKNLPAALARFEEGLKFNPKHFKCLIGLVETLMDTGQNERAYAAAKALIINHTVPIQHIPRLIRLSVVNQKFEDVVQFYETAGGLDHVDETFSSHLGAGLAICGMYFLRKRNQEKAIDAFRKAEVACRQHPRIITRILVSLMGAGLESEMKAFLSRVPPEIKDSAEIRMAQLDFWARQDNLPKALEEALRMIRENIRDEKLFEFAIRTSIALKRKEAIIQDLVWQASSVFPDKKHDFEALLPK